MTASEALENLIKTLIRGTLSNPEGGTNTVRSVQFHIDKSDREAIQIARESVHALEEERAKEHKESNGWYNHFVDAKNRAEKAREERDLVALSVLFAFQNPPKALDPDDAAKVTSIVNDLRSRLGKE